MDLIDLEANSLESLPVIEVLSSNFPGIQYLASIDEGDFIKPIYSLGSAFAADKIVLTFENLLKNTDFVKLMGAILKKLERHYKRPVDIEFTVELIPGYPKPTLRIYLLQCRPLSNREWFQEAVIPRDVSSKDQIFTSDHLVPHGIVEQIRYIVYVDPMRYSRISNSDRIELARVIGRLNKLLQGETFILMGPGRWGSSNIDLGVKVSYADIYNTRMLVEIAVTQNGLTPELSYGTHFFQDLAESNIYPLALYPDNPRTVFNHQFFDESPNILPDLSPKDSDCSDSIKVIDVVKVSQGKHLRVVMSADEGMALGYLHKYRG
jgi:hypothetical protein